MTNEQASSRIIELEQENQRLKKRIEVLEAAQEAGPYLQALLEHAPDWVFFKDRGSRFVRTSRSHWQMLGVPSEGAALGRSDLDFFPPEEAEAYLDEERALMGSGTPIIAREHAVTSHQSPDVVWVEEHKLPVYDNAGSIIGMVGIARNITERKKLEAEKAQVITELQESLERITTLSGLIPICAACKRVRNDDGYWQQVESYIREHSKADFSHGICPECARRLYPGYRPPEPSDSGGS